MTFHKWNQLQQVVAAKLLLNNVTLKSIAVGYKCRFQCHSLDRLLPVSQPRSTGSSVTPSTDQFQYHSLHQPVSVSTGSSITASTDKFQNHNIDRPVPASQPRPTGSSITATINRYPRHSLDRPVPVSQPRLTASSVPTSTDWFQYHSLD